MDKLGVCVWAFAACWALAGCGDDTGGGGGNGGDATTSGQGGGNGGATPTSSGAGGDAPTAGSPLEGSYVFALSATLSNTAPILFQGELAFGENPSAPTFTLQLTPLRTPYRTGADNETLEPLTAIPPALDLGTFSIAADGSFDAQFNPVRVTGKANPFSPNDLEATVAIQGKFSEDPAGSPENVDFVCGTLDGQVDAPISLELTADENYFSLTRIGTGGTLPDTIAYNCAGDLAVSLSGAEP